VSLSRSNHPVAFVSPFFVPLRQPLNVFLRLAAACQSASQTEDRAARFRAQFEQPSIATTSMPAAVPAHRPSTSTAQHSDATWNTVEEEVEPTSAQASPSSGTLGGQRDARAGSHKRDPVVSLKALPECNAAQSLDDKHGTKVSGAIEAANPSNTAKKGPGKIQGRPIGEARLPQVWYSQDVDTSHEQAHARAVLEAKAAARRALQIQQRAYPLMDVRRRAQRRAERRRRRRARRVMRKVRHHRQGLDENGAPLVGGAGYHTYKQLFEELGYVTWCCAANKQVQAWRSAPHSNLTTVGSLLTHSPRCLRTSFPDFNLLNLRPWLSDVQGRSARWRRKSKQRRRSDVWL